ESARYTGCVESDRRAAVARSRLGSRLGGRVGGLERGVGRSGQVGLGRLRRLPGSLADRLVSVVDRSQRGLHQRNGAFRTRRRVPGQLLDGIGDLLLRLSDLPFGKTVQIALDGRNNVVHVLAIGQRLLG